MSERTADGLFHWRKGYDDHGVMARSNGLLTDGLEWCGLLVDYCDIFSVWTLILTAPIHCSGFVSK